jgi:predicted dehydrogenase
MDKIRISVIGAGRMGSFHARVIKKNENAVLTGVYDTIEERSNALANELSVNSFKTLDDAMLASDAIVLATTTTNHIEVALKAIERGKSILIEKPIASTKEEALQIVTASEEKGITLSVGHIENFNPAFIAASRFLNEPVFTESHRMTPFAGRGSDVSVVADLMIHDIEMLLRFMGEPESIHASGGNVLTGNIDIASARISFASSDGMPKVANVTASRISDRAMRKMRVFCKGCYVSIDFASKTASCIFADEYDGIPDTAVTFNIGDSLFHRYEIPVSLTDPLTEQLTDFIDSIKNNREPLFREEEDIELLLRYLKYYR